MTDDRVAGPAREAAPPVRCVVAGGSLVGLSAAIALSRLGAEVTVTEQSPARAVDVSGGLGVDVDLLRKVTGIDADPPVLHGIDRDGTAWHLLQGWLEDHAARRPTPTPATPGCCCGAPWSMSGPCRRRSHCQ